MGNLTTYDASETKDLDYFATLPFMNATSMQREDMKIERRARLRFAKFVDAQITPDVLKGSSLEFKEKRLAIASSLRLHMEGYNTKE